MIRYFCDFCKKEIEGDNRFGRLDRRLETGPIELHAEVKISVVNDGDFIDPSDSARFHICDDCTMKTVVEGEVSG